MCHNASSRFFSSFLQEGQRRQQQRGSSATCTCVAPEKRLLHGEAHTPAPPTRGGGARSIVLWSGPAHALFNRKGGCTCVTPVRVPNDHR